MTRNAFYCPTQRAQYPLIEAPAPPKIHLKLNLCSGAKKSSMSREAESAGGAEGFEVWSLLLQVGEARKVAGKRVCAQEPFCRSPHRPFVTASESIVIIIVIIIASIIVGIIIVIIIVIIAVIIIVIIIAINRYHHGWYHHGWYHRGWYHHGWHHHHHHHYHHHHHHYHHHHHHHAVFFFFGGGGGGGWDLIKEYTLNYSGLNIPFN